MQTLVQPKTGPVTKPELLLGRENVDRLAVAVGKEQAAQFVKEYQEALQRPDDIIRQGGTSNCWFVGRLASLAANDPSRFKKVVEETLAFGLNTGHIVDFFGDEDPNLVSIGFGERSLFSRVFQRLHVARMGVDENGATSGEQIAASDEILCGGKYIVGASNNLVNGGVDYSKLMSSAGAARNLIGSQVLLQWSSGSNAKAGNVEQHAYHVVTIEKIENGQVFFREGVKAIGKGFPEGYQLHTDGHGKILGSLSTAVFANKTAAAFVSVQSALALEGAGFKEVHYQAATRSSQFLAVPLSVLEPGGPKISRDFSKNEYFEQLRRDKDAELEAKEKKLKERR